MKYDYFTKNLFIVTGAPHFSVFIFNVTKNKKYKFIENERVDISTEFVDIIIVPYHKNMFLIHNHWSIEIYQYLKSNTLEDNKLIQAYKF